MNNDSIKKICEIPIDFNQGEKSAYQLSLETGFIKDNKCETIEKIKEYLLSQVSLIGLLGDMVRKQKNN